MSPRVEMLLLGLAMLLIVAAGVAFTLFVFGGPMQPEQVGIPVVAAPEPWQLNFPLPRSPLMADLYWLHNLLFSVNVGITVLIALLILYAAVRFRSSRNPVPWTTTHNTALELTWTTLPIIVLIAIALPSFRMLVLAHVPPPPELTVKVTGAQWYWEFSYPEYEGANITSVMLPENKLAPEYKYLFRLAVDQPLILPVETNVQFLITSQDVLHGFWIPSLGLRRDAIPGRVIDAWTRIDSEGTYYGQCAVLCGLNHAYMPVAIQAVSKDAFAKWIAGKTKPKT